MDYGEKARQDRHYIAELELLVDSLSEIGSLMQSVRKENGLTQEQLAELAGISERTLRSIEAGTGNPSFAAVLSTAAILGIKISVER